MPNKSPLKDRMFKLEFIVEQNKSIKIDVTVYKEAKDNPELPENLAKMIKALESGLMNDGIIFNIRKAIGDESTEQMLKQLVKFESRLSQAADEPFVQPLEVFGFREDFGDD